MSNVTENFHPAFEREFKSVLKSSTLVADPDLYDWQAKSCKKAKPKGVMRVQQELKVRYQCPKCP